MPASGPRLAASRRRCPRSGTARSSRKSSVDRTAGRTVHGGPEVPPMARLPLLALLLSTCPALAEERTYSITIDGKPAGEMTVSFKARDDGSTAVTVRTEYRADGPSALSFEYRGTETWKDGRLVRLEGLG